MFAVVRVRVPPSARLLPLSVTEELASLSFAMLPASCALVTEMFITLLEKSAPAVAPVSMPANLVFSDEVKLTSDCVSADRTPVVLLIVRLVPTLIPPRTSASAFGNENKLAVIVSGKTNKNFKEFNVQLNYSYLKGLIKTIFSEILDKELNFEQDQSQNYDLFEKVYCDDVHIGRIGKLSKEFVGSKTKTPVFSFEIATNNLKLPTKKQSRISDYPASYRDLSFSLDNHENLEKLATLIKKYKESSELMVDCFVFDLFENKKQNLLKVGYRFKFQALENNITDEETEAVMNPLIKESLQIDGINIEGL
mgnify:CR=1 FL=1